MDRSEVGKRPTLVPEHRPAQDQATAFFPDFASFHEALEAAQLGIWSWDLLNSAVNWSPNLAALHGISPDQFDGSYAGFLNRIHEEDRTTIDAALQEAVQKRAGFRTRYRIARAPGAGERCFEITGTV